MPIYWVTTFLFLAIAFVVIGLGMKALLVATVNKKEMAQKAYKQAEDFVAEGKNKEALEKLNFAIKSDTSNADFFVTRAEVLAYFKEYQGALKDVTKSLTLQPSANAYRVRAKIFFDMNDYASAFSDLDKSLAISPTPEAYMCQGDIYAKTGNMLQAEDRYSDAIKLKPDYAEAYYLRGSARNLQGKYGDAIMDFNVAIKLDSTQVKYKQAQEFAESLQR